MRVLFSIIGSRGDVQPLVALASHLKALGHEVRVCVPPDFRDWIESLGVPVTPIGPEVRRFAASRPTATQPQNAADVRAAASDGGSDGRDTVRDVDFCRARVRRDRRSHRAAGGGAIGGGGDENFLRLCRLCAGGAAVAPPCRLPPLPGQVPSMMSDNGQLLAQDAARFNDLFGPAVNARRASLGLAEISDVRSHMIADQPWLAADATLGPWPDPTDSRVFQTGAWILSDERPLSRDLERFLESGEPPIYFGFGSTRAPEEAGPVMRSSQLSLHPLILQESAHGIHSQPPALFGALEVVNHRAPVHDDEPVAHTRGLLHRVRDHERGQPVSCDDLLGQSDYLVGTFWIERCRMLVQQQQVRFHPGGHQEDTSHRGVRAGTKRSND